MGNEKWLRMNCECTGCTSIEYGTHQILLGDSQAPRRHFHRVLIESKIN